MQRICKSHLWFHNIPWTMNCNSIVYQEQDVKFILCCQPTIYPLQYIYTYKQAHFTVNCCRSKRIHLWDSCKGQSSIGSLFMHHHVWVSIQLRTFNDQHCIGTPLRYLRVSFLQRPDQGITGGSISKTRPRNQGRCHSPLRLVTLLWWTLHLKDCGGQPMCIMSSQDCPSDLKNCSYLDIIDYWVLSLLPYC